MPQNFNAFMIVIFLVEIQDTYGGWVGYGLHRAITFLYLCAYGILVSKIRTVGI